VVHCWGSSRGGAGRRAHGRRKWRRQGRALPLTPRQQRSQAGLGLAAITSTNMSAGAEMHPAFLQRRGSSGCGWCQGADPRVPGGGGSSNTAVHHRNSPPHVLALQY
jgi:hypothetical protein